MLRQEFVFSSGPTPSCHASTIVETNDGRLAAAWFGGQQEGASDVAIWLAHRDRDGWQAPVKVASGDGVPCWNPVLHQAKNGLLLLFYKLGPSPQTWSGALRRSNDGGRTWSAPEVLPAGILGPIKNKPLELRDGTLICGSSVESYRLWGCWVERSPDSGRTWTKHGPINLPGNLFGIIQPALVARDDRHLAMFCRSRGIHQVARSESKDGGKTWTPAVAIDLPQNNSGLDAVRLRDGRLVLIYNHTTSGRTPLNLAVSGDFGKSWSKGPVLETEPGEYSYPAIIQAKNGTIHATYTWKRERIRYATFQPDDL